MCSDGSTSLSRFPCKPRMAELTWLLYHMGSRPGKRTANVLSAFFQPRVPVPDSPPRLLEMFRKPRYNSFIAASSDGICPRVFVIFLSWEFMDSIALVV